MQKVPFLKEIASYLLKSANYDLGKTCIVFPNKRARIYFSKYLGELTDTPIWAPRYQTINELMESLSGMVYADKLTLAFELYKLYGEITSSKEGFDLFYPFCETLLADFDEIDKYMIHADDLFQNLSSLKTMEGRFSYLTEEQITAIRRFWKTFNPEQVSTGQETFLTIWNILPELYRRFRERIGETGLAYEGMAYRHVAEKIRSSDGYPELDYEMYMFVGFNALNYCEEVLFRFLKNAGKAVFLYDYDTYYTSNSIHEAGYFIRKNLKNFPQVLKLDHDNLKTVSKRIVFLPVSSNVGQAKVLPSILKELPDVPGNHSDHTAIVLADESLLLPVLYSLPRKAGDINITMGYPASETAAFTLIDSLYELHRHARKDQKGAVAYHYRNVLSVINNPLLNNIFNEASCGIRKKISSFGQAFIPSAWVRDLTGDNVVFRDIDKQGHASGYLTGVFDHIIKTWLAEKDEEHAVSQMQLEGLFQTYTFVTRLQDVISNTAVEPGIEGYFRLVRRLLHHYRIPFSGEPLAGMQVMGILETRTIDFENVVILSVNEGILPRSQHFPSFIPHNLRFGFGMPTAEHQEAIYAYYFYRLLQRAKNIVLIYNDSADGLRTGECSRFLHQLRYETGNPVEESAFVFNVSRIRSKNIIIEKDERVMNVLAKYFGPGGKVLTPSAINEFLNCSLKFYFHYVSGLPQNDEVTDLVDQRLFGNLLHKSMKGLFESLGSEHADQEMLELLLAQHDRIERVVEEAFREEWHGQGSTGLPVKIEGFNLIIKQILIKYILQLLKYDRSLAPFEIISLEKPFQTGFHLKYGNTQQEIRLGGIIDRIDRHKGSVRILDYKTGRIKNSFPDVESLFAAKDRERYDAVLQVLIYTLVYSRLFPEKHLVPGLVFIRESHKDTFSYNIKYGKRQVALNFSQLSHDLEEQLKWHLARIFDEGEPFSQTEISRICSYCSYSGICHRVKGS